MLQGKIYASIYVLLMFACVGHKPASINQRMLPTIPAFISTDDDPKLKLSEGVWYYADTLFSGHVHAFHENGNIQRIQAFYKGKEEGLLITWFSSGQKESERYFADGKKIGVHRGWWENGQQRFEYHFSGGEYNGDFKEWLVNGVLAKYIEYKEGKEVRGKA